MFSIRRKREFSNSIDNRVKQLDAGTKDWLTVCESLNDVRRLALFHSGLLQPILEKVLLLILRSIKNPRSVQCKTSIMAAADIFNAFGENLLESASDAFSQLLLQLLLKTSQEKKFICEEADMALLSMVKSMAPLPLFRKLSAYIGHSNFRVRAKAAVSIYYCVSEMDLNSVEESWLKALLVMALKLLKDKLPETRGTAPKLVLRDEKRQSLIFQ
ncbi:ARM repeat superfamily protein [Perilla frutescens var. hirtella]|nr:ARM repeat superfamily protein [Perilla frutescens var. hirtella]